MRDGLRQAWAVARNDLAVWRRSRAAIAAALIPPLGMAALVSVLALSVSQQPVALVVQGQGPLAQRMANIISGDNEAYNLRILDTAAADRALRDQQVAAAVVIPPDFDQRVRRDRALVHVFLDNIDVDFADDIRRTVTRSVSEFDAPDLSVYGELHSVTGQFVFPNPYRVAVDEHDVRQTNVGFLQYQAVPVLVLLLIDVGLLGTAILSARDVERRSVKLLLVSPATRAALVLGRLLGGLLATLALLLPTVALGAATGVLRPPLAHWPALLALLLAVAVMAVGMGQLLSLLLRRTAAVVMVGLNVATCLFFLGGGFTTIAFLPAWVQALSRLVPTSYAIDGLRQALFYPDLTGFGTDMAVLGGVAAGLAIAGTAAMSRAWGRGFV